MSTQYEVGIRLSLAGGAQVASGLAQVNTALERTGSSADGAGSSFDRLGADAAAASGQVGGLSSSLERVGRDARNAETGSERLADALGRVAALGAGAVGLASVSTAMVSSAKALFEAAAGAERLRIQLQFATGQAPAREMAFVADVANRLGLELIGTAQAYAKFAAASRGTALEGQGARDVFVAVSKAAAVMGLSAEESSGALLALQQMVSKGKVQAEELRGQLGERLPGAFQIAARAMGVTTAELDKMLESGKVVADDFLPKFAAQLERELGGAADKAANRLDAATARMNNAFTRLKLAIAEAGVSDSMAAMARRANEDMTVVAEAIEGARQRGGGSLEQLGTGVAAFVARSLGLQATFGEFLTLEQRIKGAADEMERLKRLQALRPLNFTESADLAGATARYEAGRRQQAIARGETGGGRDTWGQAQLVAENARLAKLEEEARARRDALSKITDKLAGDSKDYADAIKVVTASLKAGEITAERAAELQGELAKKYKQGAFSDEARKSAAEAAKAIERGVKAAGDLIARQSGTLGDYAEKMGDLRVAFKAGAISLDEFAQAESSLWAQQPEAKAAAKALEELAKFNEDAAKEGAKHAKVLEDGVKRLRDQVTAQEAANAKIGLGTVAIAQYEAAQLERQATDLDVLASAKLLNDLDLRQYELLKAQAAELRKLAALKVSGAQKQAGADDAKEQAKALEDLNREIAAFGKANLGDVAALGFDRASQSLAAFVGGFRKLTEEQDKYNELRAKALKLGQSTESLDRAMATAQVGAYATMTAAAKGYFKEGSRGYAALQTAEKVFRAFELASAIKNATEKMFLTKAVTAEVVIGNQTQAASATTGAATEVGANMAKGQSAALAGVANQAAGDPYTAFPRMAAMAAVMAGLGFLVGGLGGGASAKIDPGNLGTGTVLGDRNAASESITNALSALADVDTMTMRYSAQMAASLRNIESQIGGVANLIVRGDVVGMATAGIRTGYKPGALQGLEQQAWNAVANVQRMIPVVGDLLSGITRSIGALAARVYGSSTKITGSGLYAGNQAFLDAIAGGLSVKTYADVQKNTKVLGATVDSSSSTRYGQAPAEIQRQFDLILSGIYGTVKTAAQAIGVSLDTVDAKLSDFVLSIGKINLKGLSGEQIQEKLSAIFGQVGDKVAESALGGLEDFQRVGEGYYETAIRVATGVEQAGVALDRLGVAAIGFADIADKQADVAAEIVRQSIVAAEVVGQHLEWLDAVATDTYSRAAGDYWVDTLSGIGQIVQTLSGSADEIASAYAALSGVRQTLVLLGQSGSAVTVELLRGAGGLTALTDALSTFESQYLTQSERLSLATSRMTGEFARLGLQMPTNAAGFAALVRGIDETTAAGQELLGKLLLLGDGFQEIAQHAAEVASERLGLERQLLELQGKTTELRVLERDALDESNRALYDQITALQDQKAAAEAAAQATAAQQSEIKGLQQQLFNLTATDAEKTAAQQSEIKGLQQQLFNLTATDAEKTAAQRAALLTDEARNLFDKVQAATKAAADAAEAEARRQTRLQQRQSLQDQIDQYKLTQEQLIAKERAALSGRQNKLLFDELQRLKAERAIADEKATLEDQLWELTATEADRRAKERDALDESNRALYDRIQLLKAEQAIAAERAGFEQQLLQVQGDTSALRALELAKLDPSNRELQKRIWAIEDEAIASEAARQAAQAALDAAKTTTDSAFAALQRAVDAQKTIAQAAVDAAQEQIDAAQSVFDAITGALRDLYGEVASTSAMSAVEGRSFIDSALAAAQSSGYLPDAQALTDAISSVRDGMEATAYASAFESQRDRLVLAGKLAQLQTVSGRQASVAEQQLAAAKAQLESLDATLAAAQAQVDAIRGVDRSVIGVQQAIAALASAIASESAAAAVAQAASSASTPTAGSVVNASDSALLAAAKIVYQSATGGVSTAAFNAAEEAVGGDIYGATGWNGDPASFRAKWGFAKGGLYPGGLALVGEEGPELINFARPGQVYTAGQTESILGGGSEVATELRAMREELRAQARAVVQLQSRQVRVLETWDGQGLPTERVEA